MQRKRTGKKLWTVCALALVIALSAGATTASAVGSEKARGFFGRGPREELTEEQKADMDARIQERLADGEAPEGHGRPDKHSRKDGLTDEKKSEMQAKLQEKLAQKLADGEITQEQYDEMLSAIENGKMARHGGPRGAKKPSAD